MIACSCIDLDLRPNARLLFSLGLCKRPGLRSSFSMWCDDLKTWITEALKTIDPDMLVGVWQEMEYRFVVCRLSKSLHIEHF